MATYQQYSEVVAAYGYTMPPPAQPQVNRIGLALLYAAIGVALGTMAGTGMAAVSLQPGGVAGWAHRLNVPTFAKAVKSAHPTAHGKAAPLVVAHATPAHPIVPAAPVAALKAVPAPPASAPSASAQAASAAPAPALARTQAATPLPAAHPGILARVIPSTVVEASVDVTGVQRELTVHHEVSHARLALAPVAHRLTSVAPAAMIQNPAAPAVKLASIRMPAALPVPAVMPVSLNEEVSQANFFSEGDATVVDYDATLGTILTDDGRTFVIGPTVSMSGATSWNDYRANVHYRCDQGGKCTIMRTGVIALDAKLI
jgi:hypothetical protein